MRMAQPWQSHGRSVEHGSTLIGPLLIATREQRRFDQESEANGLVQLGKTKRESERDYCIRISCVNYSLAEPFKR